MTIRMNSLKFESRKTTITTPQSGNAAARRVQLTTGTGYVFLWNSGGGELDFKAGDSSVDAQSSPDGSVPDGWVGVIEVGDAEYFSVSAAADFDLTISEVS